MISYEEYAASHSKCIQRSVLAQQASEQRADIDTLIQQANTQGITVIMWA